MFSRLIFCATTSRLRLKVAARSSFPVSFWRAGLRDLIKCDEVNVNVLWKYFKLCHIEDKLQV